MGNSPAPPRMEAPFVVEASAQHTSTVIFLHGLGDTGQGWAQAFEKIRLPHVKYICPTANSIPVTFNGRTRMPAWFDIRGMDPNSQQDEEGIRSSAQLLQQLVSEEERRGIARNRIIVGGFSQGGAVALFSSLALAQQPFAGILALSTWLPLHTIFPSALRGNQQTPILQCHGTADVVVAHTIGAMTSQLIRMFNPQLTFRSYRNMGHSSCDEELQDVQQFIEARLPAV